jgi:putative hemolysin
MLPIDGTTMTLASRRFPLRAAPFRHRTAITLSSRRRGDALAFADGNAIREMAMHLTTQHQGSRHDERFLSVALATAASDIEAAQRLRDQVFAGDPGAPNSQPAPRRDQDFFDPWCQHLIARDDRSGEIVGTYRILTADGAKRLGTFHADTEFDLTRLALLKPAMCEIGRACIHPEYRNRGAIMRLWQGLATFMLTHGYRYVIGCASIAMGDGGANALRVWRRIATRHLAPIEYRVFPRHPLVPADDAMPIVGDDVPAAVPALLKGYLRLGAWIGGEPARDPDLNTADLFVFLPLSRVQGRYARHYLKAA